MKLELDHITIQVKDLEEAKKFFAELFETKFVDKPKEYFDKIARGEIKYESTVADGAPTTEKFKSRVAMSEDLKINICQITPPPPYYGLRNICWRVKNLEQAKAEMLKKGLRPIAENKCGRWKEAVYRSEDMHGIRWSITEYEGPNMFEGQVRT